MLKCYLRLCVSLWQLFMKPDSVGCINELKFHALTPDQYVLASDLLGYFY